MNSNESSHSSLQDSTSDSSAKPQQTSLRPSRFNFRLIAGLVVLAVILIAGWMLRDSLTLQALARNETRLREYQQHWPILVAFAAFLIYTLVTGFSLPGAAVLTLAFGWYFGLLQAFVIVSFASTLGATIAFLISRYLVRDWAIRRLGSWYERIDQAFEREGAYYLFTLRLIPAVPFFVINAVMGLTRIRVRTFWWVSQLGMLPGTLVYTYVGASLPSPQALQEKGLGSILDPRLAIAFTLLGVMPLILKRLVSALSRHRQRIETDSPTDSIQAQ